MAACIAPASRAAQMTRRRGRCAFMLSSYPGRPASRKRSVIPEGFFGAHQACNLLITLREDRTHATYIFHRVRGAVDPGPQGERSRNLHRYPRAAAARRVYAALCLRTERDLAARLLGVGSRPATTGSRGPGSRRRNATCGGRPVTGAGSTTAISGTPATGVTPSAFTAASTTARDTTATATSAAIGPAPSSATTPPLRT